MRLIVQNFLMLLLISCVNAVFSQFFGPSFADVMILKRVSVPSIEIEKSSTLCRYEGCSTRASFGMRGKPAEFCFTHKKDDMVSRKSAPCQYPGCDKNARFGFPRERAKFCVIHKESGSYDKNARENKFGVKTPRIGASVVKKICCLGSDESVGVEGLCQLSASPWETRRSFPIDCKESGLRDKEDKKFQPEICCFVGCFQKADCNFSSGYCRDHRHELTRRTAMTWKPCRIEGCKLRASFGYRGRGIEFCYSHKQPDMKERRGSFCQHPGCPLRASFGFPNEKGRFCSTHKEPGMGYRYRSKSVPTPKMEVSGTYQMTVDPDLSTVGKRGASCGEPEVTMSFSVSNEQYIEDQEGHDRLGDMLKELQPSDEASVLLANPPEYHLSELYTVSSLESSCLRVRERAKEGKGNWKYCRVVGCRMRANFGLTGKGVEFCREHRQNSMVSFKRCCQHPGCGSGGTFHRPGENERFCRKHKTADMSTRKSIRKDV